MRVIQKLLVILALVAVLVMPAAAQTEGGEIVLVPFEDPNYQIEGVIPEGWQALGQGLYSPDPEDFTLLALQAAPTTLDRVFEVLLPQLGLTTAPDAVGTLDTESLSWLLYQVDVPVGAILIRVDLALAETPSATYIALLQTPSPFYDQLHAEVFIPVLNGLTPTTEAAEDLPYGVFEVTFEGADGVSLVGTLTLPDTPGPHPAIALMTGSGPQTRDSEVVPGFPIFAQIADHLTRAGFAVLRYDDRGVGLSEGDYSAASIQDFAADGVAAVAFLRGYEGIDPDAVGILGHSEGGAYASIIGAQPQDETGVAFIIALAAPGVDGESLLLRQNELILRGGGASEAIIASQLQFLRDAFPLIAERDWDAMEELTYQTVFDQWGLLLPEERGDLTEDQREQYARQAAAAFRQGYAFEWFATLMAYDPAPDWAQTTVPVLAVFGGLDVQVEAAQNADPIEAALAEGGNEDVTVVTLDDANHLFQAAETGALEEYDLLALEFTPDLLPLLTDWLTERFPPAAGEE